MNYLDSTDVLHVVFDRYNSMSAKSSCRTARSKGLSRVYKLSEESPLPKQEMVLNVTANKEQIIQLIVTRLCIMDVTVSKKLIVTGPDPYPVHVGVGRQETAITHEEADIIMTYHMITEAAAGHTPIKVVSDDTDVLLLLAHHLHARTNEIPTTLQLYMESCTRDRTVININTVVEKHASILPNLLAAHALTGCDTVSSLSGIGKATVLKKLVAFPGELNFGNVSSSQNEIINSCLEFVATLYGQETLRTLNEMRSSIFTKKK